VRDGGTDLRLDVVPDDRDAGSLELRSPLGVGRDEDGEGVDERDARVDRALRVVLRGLLRADREVADEHVGLGVLEHLDDVDRLGVGLLDGLGVVLAEPVEGVPTLHGDAGGRHVGDLDRVVLGREDGLGEVEADLLGVHVERGHELEVRDVVVAELDVHESRDLVVRVGVLVELDALDQ